MTTAEKLMAAFAGSVGLGAAVTIVLLASQVVPEMPAERTVKEPTAPSGVLVLLDDAPEWCLDPDYPRGDMWYESCVEPRP